MDLTPKRQSIEPTYDSRETGPRYHVTTRIDGKTIGFREPIADPFVRQTVCLGWADLLRGLLRRHLAVEVIVSGDRDVVNDVMELDANTLTPNSTRSDESAVAAEAIALLVDLVVKCTEYGTQDGGFVAMYLLPTGPVHRAIPWLEQRGITVRPGFDGRKA